MRNKAKVNYWIDVVIGICFLIAGVSGLVFLFDTGVGAKALGLSFRVWDSLHLWGGVLMIAGVIAHLGLHWSWIRSTTVRMIQRERQKRSGSAHQSGRNEMKGGRMSRRALLALAGSAAVTTCLTAFGCGALALVHHGRKEYATAQAYSAEDSPLGQALPLTGPLTTPEARSASDMSTPALPQSTPTMPTQLSTPTAEALGVACRKGMVNDPYPGRCRDYVDRDGDGYCDFSILGSGTNTPR